MLLLVAGISDPLHMSHLTALKPLSSNLQSLELSGEHVLPEAQHYRFLGSLTSLTRLCLPLASTNGLSCLSLCTNLQHLKLDADKQHGAAGIALPNNPYNTFASLTKLTELRLPNVGGSGGNPAFVKALMAMPQLQILHCDGLNRKVLPVLSQVANLTEIGSRWDEADVEVGSGSVCDLSCVRTFGGCGPIPFESFQHVQCVCQWEPWPPSNFLALARHCRKLKVFRQDNCTTDIVSMRAAAPEVERVAALSALASLEHLTQLVFSPVDDSELAVLAGLTRLQCLHLLACRLDHVRESPCNLPGLMLLCQMRRLRVVVIELPGMNNISSSQARMLLIGLSHVPHVGLFVRHTCIAAFDEAAQAAKAAGLPVPNNLVFVKIIPKVLLD